VHKDCAALVEQRYLREGEIGERARGDKQRAREQ
jgi:hypothetical protein